MEAAHLPAALAALFGSDAAQQQAANAWLSQFAKTPEAWGAALGLLDAATAAAAAAGAGGPAPPASATAPAFAAATLLLSKTRDEWSRLDANQRSELTATFTAQLRALLFAVPPAALPSAVPAVLAERVCLLAVAAAVLRGAGAVAAVMGVAAEAAAAGREALGAQGPAQAGGALLLRWALLLLQQLAEEAGELDSGRRQALVSPPADAGGGGGGGLAARKGEVVALTREVLDAGSITSAGPDAAALPRSAVRCCGAWLALDVSASGAGGYGTSPAEAQALSPSLLVSLVALLGGEAGEDAAAVVRDLLGPEGAVAPAAAGGAAADAAATAAAMQALVAATPVLATAAAAEARAGGGDGSAAEARLVGALGVAAAVAERNAGGVASAGEAAVALAQAVMAALAECPTRRVASAAADYLLALNTTPTAERHPALAAPLYSAVLPYVLRAAAYPPGFSGWEEAEEDEDAFHRFRDQEAADLLESMYAQCRTPLLAALVAEAAGPHDAGASGGPGAQQAAEARGGGVDSMSWQSTEAALYAVRALHLPVKAAALGGRAGELDSPEAAARAAETNVLLLRLFTDVCCPPGRVASMLRVPWLAASACRLVAEYAAWFGKEPASPLQAAFSLLLAALAVRPAAPPAATAFRNLCVRAGERLSAEPAALEGLARAAMGVVAPPPPAGGGPAPCVALGAEERCGVVEGLARLAAGLPTESAAAAGTALMGPCVARVQAIAAAAAVAGGPLSPAALSSLAAELGLMGALVRFMEAPRLAAAGGTAGGGPGGGAVAAAVAAAAAAAHPVIRVLEVAWPVLSAVAAEPQCAADPGVVEALAEVYKRCLLSTKLAARPLLAPLMGSLARLLGGPAPQAGVLDALGTVVELFGEVASSGEARGLQVAALEAACGLMGRIVAAGLLTGGGTAAPAAPSPVAVPPSSPGELAAAFFTLADRYLIFARELLLAEAGAALPSMLQWACGVLCACREREPVAAALAFVTHLLAAAERVAAEAVEASGGATSSAEMRGRLDATLLGAGPALTAALLAAGTDTCPRALMRPLAGCLAALASAARAPAAAPALREGLPAWLSAAWSVPPLAGLLPPAGRLGAAAVQRFTALLLRGHPPPFGPGGAPLPRGRLDALVADFCGVARGEASEDVLLGYELA